MAKLLIVDDGEGNRELLAAALQHAGHEIFQACNGFEALQQLRTHLPDLAIIDIQMPGMDGYAVLASAQQDPLLQKIPMVALTAYAMQTDRDRGLQAGFCEYISKPVPIRRLLQLLEPHLPNHQPPQPPPTS